VVTAYEKLENILPQYIARIKNRTNTEDKIVHEFTYLIQNVFDIGPEELDFQTPVKSKVLQIRGRMDTIFKNIILEFKRDLNNVRALNTAKDELHKYFQSLYELDPKIKHLGIATDGIYFKVYQAIILNNKVSEIKQINEIKLDSSNVESIFNWFDSYLFSSVKIKPTSEHLKQSFGINSPFFAIAKQELLELYNDVKDNHRTKVKYDNWSRFLEIVYGDKPNELNLFITHTYLSTFAKLLVYSKIKNQNQSWSDEISYILWGGVFTKLGIRNFVEEDFFTWTMSVSIRKKSSKLFEKILRDLEIYDLDEMDEDVMKELYQDMIRPDVRKQLGEFYTPDWLADKMVDEILSKNYEKSVLDPSCGSGTFLFKTILYKINKLHKQGMDDKHILSHILENVIGFDIHPLATLIAKTNYLLALKGVLHSRVGPITIPVYLSDSLKVPTKKMTITNSLPTFEFDTQILNKTFEFPESFADDIIKMDDVIEKMKNHGHELDEKLERIDKLSSFEIKTIFDNLKQSFERSISNITNHNEKEILMNNIQTLFELIQNDSDSIWPYILRNMYKPIPLTQKKVDVIIGNPPWIAQHSMQDLNYKKYLKQKSIEYELVEKNEVHNIPNLELASLFFCNCVSQYLSDKGVIGFVMPKSILLASQHGRFRKFQNPLVKLFLVYDLEQVTPLFRIPSCVIFAKKDNVTKYPVKSIKIDGKLSSTNEQLTVANTNLRTTSSTFSPISRKKNNSPYHKKFKKGADLIPRIFWYVDIESDTFMGFNPKNPHIISSENKNAKLPWKKIVMDGNVSEEFLFNTLVATDVIPFGILRRRLIFLPIIVTNGNITVINSSSHPILSNSDTSKYLETVEKVWEKNSKGTASTMTTYEWINYKNKLSMQNLNYKFKVLFVGSATYMTACVLKSSEKYSFNVKDVTFTTSKFITDYSTYYFDTNNEMEAYYLCAILNSKTIDDLIKPEQSRGNFGPRNINKLPLTFNIPSYDSSSEHIKLAKLGMACEEKAISNISKIPTKSTGDIRRKMRQLLNEEIIKIDKIANNLLKEDLK
jgi:hypothetical protein